jgi:hypothetical protein
MISGNWNPTMCESLHFSRKWIVYYQHIKGPLWVVFSAVHRNLLGVRCVPIAAPCDSLFSVPSGDNRRSDSVNQRPSCAQLRH